MATSNALGRFHDALLGYAIDFIDTQLLLNATTVFNPKKRNRPEKTGLTVDFSYG